MASTGRRTTPKTALARDYGFTAVDDYDTRTYILPWLTDSASRERIIAEHKAHPRGVASQPGHKPVLHSEPLRRLIDRLRVTPQAGKHTIVEMKPWSEYAIGILPGRRGGEVKITGERYATREDAEHAIFLKRLRALLEQHGIVTPARGKRR